MFRLDRHDRTDLSGVPKAGSAGPAVTVDLTERGRDQLAILNGLFDAAEWTDLNLEDGGADEKRPDFKEVHG